MHWSKSKESNTKRLRNRKITKGKNKRKLVRLLKKWLFGVNFTLAFMMKMETISKNHCKVRLNKSESRKKLWTIISYKSGMEKNMVSILTKNLIPKLVSFEHLFEMRKRKRKKSESEPTIWILRIIYNLYKSK